MLTKTLIAVSALAIATPALAQSAFEFRGETTTTQVDMATKQGCSPVGLGRMCSNGLMSMGGVDDVYLGTSYYQGRMYGVDGIFGTEGFPTLLRAFTEKYGEPKLSTATWQNRAGATFDNDIATWTFSDGTLTLKRLGGRISDGSFSFVAPQNRPPAEAPTVDF